MALKAKPGMLPGHQIHKRLIPISTALLVGISFWFLQDLRDDRSNRPVAEFEPTEFVLVSEFIFGKPHHGLELAKAVIDAGAKVLILANIDSDFQDNKQVAWLEEELGSGNFSLLPASHESLWVRDFGPIPTVRFHAHSGSELVLADFLYRDTSKLDDTIPYQTGLYLEASLTHLPLPFDGGNFMTDGDTCLLTDDFRGWDDFEASVPELRQNQKNALKNRLKDAIGCRKVHIIADAPHEHIDMWLKFTSPGRVLVNQINSDSFKPLSMAAEHLIQVQNFARRLDEIASELVSLGLTVKRLPQPVPHPEAFFTYANTTLVNQTAIIPSYRTFAEGGDDFAEYERQVAVAYDQEGFTPVFVDAAELIRDGGALHCVTSQVPFDPGSGTTIAHAQAQGGWWRFWF